MAGKTLTRSQSILYLQLSNVFFAATAVCVSLLSSRFDGYFTSFCRFLVGLAIGLAELAARKRPFKIVRFKPWLGRGIFGAAGMILYYISIALGTPGRASVLNNSFPLFVAVIAVLVLREDVRAATVAGLILAFSGVALVLWDGAAVTPLADAVGIASGFIAGISYHFNKRASKTEDPIVIYLGVCIVGILATAFSLPQAARLDVASTILLLLAGAGAYVAQICITIGLRDIPTTEGSVHTFAKIPLTVIAGIAFLGDSITMRFVAGTALLIVGLFLNQLSKKTD
ncbi:MAG TPA: DMT family transporter [Treponemataceae bacterium]|nr:DMT family transporter [Treponemataceae bacterium]